MIKGLSAMYELGLGGMRAIVCVDAIRQIVHSL